LIGVQYPLKACCGAGGEYNFVIGIPCGSSGYVNGTLVKAERCDDPSLYITWDGAHLTETFARYVADGLISGSFLQPQFNIKRKISAGSKVPDPNNKIFSI
jgi:hypothetical protein